MSPFELLAPSPAGNSLRTRSLLRTLKTISCGCLGILLLLTGCTRLKVKLGSKVYLDRIAVTSMKVSMPGGPAIAPGKKLPLVATFTQPDGKTLVTEGKGGGKVLWKDLKLESTVVNANKKGVVSLSPDPRVSDGKIGHVVVTVPSHPDLRAELDIPPRYDVDYSANFSGSKGMDGHSGTDGSDGSSGSMGSTDPNHPIAGGDGGNGSDGSNGGDGSDGGDAPNVVVKMTLNPGSQTLLEVGVSAAGRETYYYLIDPNGGSLTIVASGGDGGSGGKGGRGGRGGSGGIGTPNGSSGRSGSDGRNGWDGHSGRGGLITVVYDPQAAPYLRVLHPLSANGPQPVYREETVEPLW